MKLEYKITGLALLNFILQIFFIRIYKGLENGKLTQVGLLYWVVPFTGWWSPYKTLGGFMHTKAILKL